MAQQKTTKERPDPTPRPTSLVQEYLRQRMPTYCKLADLQRQAWESKDADSYFEKRQYAADNANIETQTRFYYLMQQIGNELQRSTSALTIPTDDDLNKPPAILDLCMAPGGFAAAALKCNPTAILRGISLPVSLGGHEMRIPHYVEYSGASTTPRHLRIMIDFRDITMLATEMMADSHPAASDIIPPTHPDKPNFSPDRPFLETKFDLVFCDGQVLRAHRNRRLAYREDPSHEELRLLTSQLVLAIQRVRSGGTLIILLHRLHSWRSVALIHAFMGIAEEVSLFKPQSGHAMRTSFYLIVKGVRAGSEAAGEVVGGWKRLWWEATFGEGWGEGEEAPDTASDEKVRGVLEEIGDKLVRWAEPVFGIQEAVMRKAPFMRRKREGSWK